MLKLFTRAHQSITEIKGKKKSIAAMQRVSIKGINKSIVKQEVESQLWVSVLG